MDWGRNSDHRIEDDTPNPDTEKFYKMIEEVLWMPTKYQRMVLQQGWICKRWKFEKSCIQSKCDIRLSFQMLNIL